MSLIQLCLPEEVYAEAELEANRGGTPLDQFLATLIERALKKGEFSALEKSFWIADHFCAESKGPRTWRREDLYD